jgi:tRNA-2-methylthio-N6-dimethylallyladenosine synthase
MNRTYTREQYLDKIALIRGARRGISITTDIIVGFPGESTNDFDETLTLLDAAQYDGIFTFLYSPRPQTPAMSLPGQIPEEEKVRRLQALQERQREIQQVRNQRLVGQEVEVLVEGHSERTGQWIGRTTANRVVNFESPQEELGSYVPVRVTHAGPNSLVGERVQASVAAE